MSETEFATELATETTVCQLIYASAATVDFSDEELSELLDKARVNNKRLGWGLMVMYFLALAILPNVGLEHNMLLYAQTPGSQYSDMNQYGHAVSPLLWFNLYWSFFAVMLAVLGLIFDGVRRVWRFLRRTVVNLLGRIKLLVRAARGMRQRLADLNEAWAGRGIDPLSAGIGLHIGEVVQGAIGSHNRKDFTVIGDAVNTASRVESLTKQYTN